MEVGEVIRQAGGALKLGEAIGRSRSTILEWTRVPAEHVPAISQLLGVSRHELRPDLYEPEPKWAPKSESAPTQPLTVEGQAA